MRHKPWRKYLLKSELKHLKDVHVRTKRDFIELNIEHNTRRKVAGTGYNVEPCYQCKSIAIKLGLDVVDRGRMVVEHPVVGLKTKTKYQAVELKQEPNKPIKKEVSRMRIIDIKCPIIRRLCLCCLIAPCVIAVMFTNIRVQLKCAWFAGLETFAELWEGCDGNSNS